MSIKALVKQAAFQVAETLHSNPEAIPLFSAREVAELVYQNINFDSIEYQYLAKNKIIHEILPVAEEIALLLNKKRTDTAFAQDVFQIALGRAFNDLVDTLDANLKVIGKGVKDNPYLIDTLVKSFVVPKKDTAIITDPIKLGFTASKKDGVIPSDKFAYYIYYRRKFTDYVAVDDFAGIDKYYNGTKHNVTFAVDRNYLGLSKRLHDLYVSNDYSVLKTGKNFKDSVAFVEDTSVSLIKHYLDSYGAEDSTSFQQIKPIHDNNIEVSNRIYLSSIIGKTDIAQAADSYLLRTNKKLSDNTFFVDKHNFVFNKSLTDTATVQEVRKLKNFTKVNKDVAFTHERYSAILNKVRVDTTTPIDKRFFSYTFSFSEFPLIGDYKILDAKKVLNDSPVVLDIFAANYTKALQDTNSTAIDFSVLRVNKNPADDININDKVDLIFTAGANAMFNVALFNQSTFG